MANKADLKSKIDLRVKNQGLVLYDGDCGFCQFWVQFILDRDVKSYFLFAPLQAPWAMVLIGKDRAINLDTVLFYENGVLFEKSTAALKIAKKLKWPWKSLYLFSLIPKFLRDIIYDFIAKRRHKISIKETCRLPSAEERQRFLKNEEF